MEKNVVVGVRLQENGITENHRGFPSKKSLWVAGGDTETVHGKAHTFQLVSQGEELIERTDSTSIFASMMRWIMPRIADGGVNIVWFHNLRFDLTIIFNQHVQAIYNQYNDIHFETNGFVVRMLYGRVNMARIWQDYGGYLCAKCGEIPKEAVIEMDGKNACGNMRKHGVKYVTRNLSTCVKFMDSAAFCPPGSKSLAAALKIYGVPYKKLPMPEGLGDKPLWDEPFKMYALNDARVEEALGNKILDLHKEYDITPCVSLPQLAGRILRHHFFLPKESLVFPPEGCRESSELSYHAGKNGFYVKRGIYEDVYEYDINSAFPKAMLEMPQLVKGQYKYVKRFHKGVMGIYRISGVAFRPRIPAVFDHAFCPVRGEFSDLWITGYELENLFEAKDHKFKIIDGWIWKHSKKYQHSPLAGFVERFWELKKTTPKGPKRDTYKNIMNSLYGKFAACVEKRPMVETAFGLVACDDTPTREKYFVAGALYHPFIATQITGYVRRELYRLERRGDALHAATDSIKTFRKLDTSDELGGIKEEVFGRCYLFRNKLYLHFAKDNKLCGHNLEKGWLYVSKEMRGTLPCVGRRCETGQAYDPDEDLWRGKIFEDGQHLCKYGLHGFKGSVFNLYMGREALIANGYADYEYDHMVNLREGMKRGETISDMVRRKERITLKENVDIIAGVL